MGIGKLMSAESGTPPISTEETKKTEENIITPENRSDNELNSTETQNDSSKPLIPQGDHPDHLDEPQEIANSSEENFENPENPKAEKQPTNSNEEEQKSIENPDLSNESEETPQSGDLQNDEEHNDQDTPETNETFLTSVEPEPGITVQYNLEPDPAEIEAAYTSLMNYGTLPVDVHRPYVIKVINRHKVEALMVSDYTQAQKLDEALTLLTNDYKFADFQKSQRLKQNSCASRIDTLKQKLQAITQKWDNKAQQARSSSEKRIHDLEENHDNEVKNFKKQWRSPDFLRTFNRPSPELSQLRLVEKKMALAKLYDEARRTKRIADELQGQEEQKMQIVIEEKMRADFIKMRTRHKMELDRLNDYNTTVISEIEFQRHKETEPIKTAIKQMKAKMDENSSSKRLPRSLLFPPDENELRATLPSPRTAKLLNQYRDEKKAELKIAPADDTFFEHLIKTPLRANPKRAKSSLPPL